MIYKSKDKLCEYPTSIATLKNISDNNIIFLDEFTQRNYRSLSNLSTHHYIHSMSFDIVEKGDIYYGYDSGYQHIKRKMIKGSYKDYDYE